MPDTHSLPPITGRPHQTTLKLLQQHFGNEDTDLFLDRDRLWIAITGADAHARVHKARGLFQRQQVSHTEFTTDFEHGGLRIRELATLMIPPSAEKPDLGYGVIIAFAPGHDTSSEMDDEIGIQLLQTLASKDCIFLADNFDDIPAVLRPRIQTAIRLPASTRLLTSVRLLVDHGVPRREAIEKLRAGFTVADILRSHSIRSLLPADGLAHTMLSSREARGEPISRRPPVDLDLYAIKDDGYLVDTHKTVRALARNGRTAWALTLYGVPGTGKTSLAAEIARLADMPFIDVDLSKVLGPHVSDNERNLARLFADARSTQSIICINEGEDLAANRADSSQTWERRLTNMLIRLIDAHTLPIIFTTNHLEAFDPAILRRSPDKLELCPLPAARFARAWERIVGTPLPIEPRDGFVPADLDIIRRKQRLYGDLPAEQVDAILAAEAGRRASTSPGTGRIGFDPHRWGAERTENGQPHRGATQALHCADQGAAR